MDDLSYQVRLHHLVFGRLYPFAPFMHPPVWGHALLDEAVAEACDRFYDDLVSSVDGILGKDHT